QTVDQNKIDSLLHIIESENEYIGSVSIFKHGKEIYNRSFGQKNLGNIRYTKNTKYQIGSITKTVTAALLFKLVEKGELSLDEKLSGYFPKVPNSSKISIKNLLEHSSGLKDFSVKNDSIDWLKEKVSEQEIWQEIIRQGYDFEPGEKVDYSNSGYYILTKIIETKYGKPYKTLVQDHIAQPLGLKNFHSIQSSDQNIFKSYSFKENWEEIKDFDFSNAIGVGDIVSTTYDLNRFLTHLFEYKILKKETVELMKPVIGKEMFGRGLMLVPYYEIYSFGHGGDTYGTHSLSAYNEERDISISYSINAARKSVNRFGLRLVSLIYGAQLPDKEISLSPEELNQYTGIYSSPELPIKLTIKIENGKLTGQGDGQPSFPLTCYEKNHFKFDKAMVKLEFIPTENKMILMQNGHKFEMKRQ
ncbi:MAG: beta-lactamase family protein, partial [Leadbetterella sp.]|nr:beta-lactamase family protein [Leadbetterella sp.]